VDRRDDKKDDLERLEAAKKKLEGAKKAEEPRKPRPAVTPRGHELSSGVTPPKAAPQAAVPQFVAEHTVQAGDTLSEIALKYYGNASRRHYMYIFNTNKDVIGKDPNNIQVGMELKLKELPERLKGEKVAPPEGVAVIAEHTVVADETLSSIAQKYYNNTSEAAWMAIYEANKDEIGDNPNIILVGMHLFIPQFP
jgi:nucleoid-associated protein YgaU